MIKKHFILYFLLVSVFAFAEDVKISTYYPSPYGTYKQLQIENYDDDPSITEFTTKLIKSGINIITDYSAIGAYTPGIFWSTLNDNSTKPKTGIWMYEVAAGSKIFFGTSNAFGTGITNNMVLDQDGDLGINTTSPASPLHASRNGGATPMETLARYANDALPPSFDLVHGRGTQILPTRPAANDGLGAVRFQGVNTASQNYDGAVIQSNATANWSATSAPANLVIQTTAVNTTAPAERMRLTEDGALQMPGRTVAPAVSTADTGRVYYNATTDNFLVSQSTLPYAPLMAVPGPVCVTVDTGLAANGNFPINLVINNRNICQDITGCSFRIWTYTAARPEGDRIYPESFLQQNMGLRQATNNQWYGRFKPTDMQGAFGTNGDGVSIEIADWSELVNGLNFRILDDSAAENSANQFTLEDNLTTRGFVATFCDF